MKQKFFILGIILAAIGLLLFSCSSENKEENLLARVKEIHEKALTVDTHADTPSRLLSGEWKIGERHDPEARGSGCMVYTKDG